MARCSMFAYLYGPSAAVMLLVSQQAFADQILEIHNDSLTTFLPSSATSVQDLRPGVTFNTPSIGDGGLSALQCGILCHPPFTPEDPWDDDDNGGCIDPPCDGCPNPPCDGGCPIPVYQPNGIDWFSGSHRARETDLKLPSDGHRWVIGRSYSAHQEDNTSGHHDSDGYQGKNWFQISQPEILFYDDASNEKDAVYLIYGADRYATFIRKNSTSNEFKSKNGARGVMQFAAGTGSEPDTYTFTGQRGVQMVFFGFDADAAPAKGQLWKIIDPAGNTAYVGDKDTASTAISNGFDSSGYITVAYDSAGRRYTYTYTTLDSVDRLTKVEVATYVSETWTNTGDKVEYAYYQTGDNTYGDNGNLKLVTITTPLTDSGVDLVKKKYFRYWKGTFDADTNPGHPNAIQYVLDFEGTRSFDWSDETFDDDFETASESALKPYASAYFEYDSSHRIAEAWYNGDCGCSGAADGTYAFEYENNSSYTDNTGYDTTWKSRTIVEQPSGSYITQYYDEVGQYLHRVITDADPDNTNPAPEFWATKVVRNSDGQITDIHSPANVTAYTHSTASFTTSTTDGLVTVITRVASGDMKGFVEDTKHKKGTSGSAYLDETIEYSSATKTVGDVTITRPFIKSRWVYSEATTTEAGGGSGPSGAYETSFTYTFWTGDAALRPKQVTTSNPAVSTSKNGSGTSTSSKRFLRKDGTTAFTESTTGIFTYTQFVDGQPVKAIEDAQTNHATDFATGDDPNTDFGITETSDGVRRITTLAYDDQGRSDAVTLSDGRVRKQYYSKLKDNRPVTLAYNDYEASPLKFYGPVQYTVTNQAGRTEVQAVVALTSNESTTALTGHVDETDSDPITAMDLGTVAQMMVSVYDETGGALQETRLYHTVPASGDGTDGANYDASFFGYDDPGRRVRVKQPTGTISRTDYDSLGRVLRQWIGTNDSSFAGGEPSGTDNMVKTLENVYDSGNDKGNSYLTKRTLYVQDSATDKRETTFSHDLRGNVLLQTNSTAPHVFNKFDNMQRPIAVGHFSSTASISVATDDPTTESTNRLTLAQTFYDEMGRAWKSQRHKIDDADGSDDDNLQRLTWHDAAGRVIKLDGGGLTKMSYDRLGRRTHVFVLSDDNDTAYAHADDVTGDHVLTEWQTSYESTDSDLVLMIAAIDRFHDDISAIGSETKGALDTNADGDDLKYTASNVKGRIQITASWYDRFGRVIDSVSYGMYDTDSDGDFDDFDRDGLSVPARSDTALLTEREYNTDGTLKEVTDPKALVTRYEYDDTGRQTKVIENYVDGTPSGDSDRTVSYSYTDGLRTKLTADLPAGSDDQQTIYVYGTTKGASAGDSEIATGHLLQTVQYPESSGGSDVVTFAYNAQSQQIWTEDQEGNVVETDFDDAGRETHRRITTLDGDFDGAVRRISTTYDDLGRRQLVTQYDNATVGSGSVVDEVKFTYDDWGPVSKFEQDHNSAVNGGDDYEVSYTYAKATSGRNTIRRTNMTMPDATSLTYDFRGLAGRLDDKASRVTRVKVGATVVADYDYNGVRQVVGTDLPEPDVMWKQFTTSGTYPDLDRFNRVTSSRWTKDLSTDVDFYDLDVTYDRNSNITLVEDKIHVDVTTSTIGLMDVAYTIDDLNRLTNAEEGDWTGSAITATTREQIWDTLSHTGNWDRVKLDLDGNGTFTGTGEYDDARTSNKANELTTRDTDNDPITTTNNYTHAQDAVGNLIDDGENYEYVYDPFGRLRKITTRDATPRLVAEYNYNGLGYRIDWTYDTNDDNTVNGSDATFHFVYDDRWRIVATYRDDDTDPKEQFVYHNAGDDGLGAGSYIDAVILRDKDANTAWASASDGTLEERVYYCQNWRADVVALITDGGDQVEQARYSAYGVPFGLPAGDANSDGKVDSADVTQIQTWIDAPAYDVRGDVDLDNDVDSNDKTTVSNNAGNTLGWGVMSIVGNRKGYAGYELDDAIADAYRLYHVRNRVLNADLGRWTKRDPVGYAGGSNLYEYASARPIVATDPSGLILCLKGYPEPLLDLLNTITKTTWLDYSACGVCDGNATHPWAQGYFPVVFMNANNPPPGPAGHHLAIVINDIEEVYIEVTLQASNVLFGGWLQEAIDIDDLMAVPAGAAFLGISDNRAIAMHEIWEQYQGQAKDRDHTDSHAFGTALENQVNTEIAGPLGRHTVPLAGQAITPTDFYREYWDPQYPQDPPMYLHVHGQPTFHTVWTVSAAASLPP